jgi:hypothetical protein
MLPRLLRDPWRKQAQLTVWARCAGNLGVAESRLIEVTPIIVRHEVTQHSTSIMSPSMNVHEPLDYSVSGKSAWGMSSTLLLIRM